ncbi:peptidyl-prolyl cis-trans isomerase CYP59 [Typha latifolia]|uniref:peptidyl-prolyl cis-trans isomerase CYP59 n=1 Tax=Typha latifolia TaxID=4733 RepID=UPI003C2D5827
MSVLFVTSVGDFVVDLHTDRCPLTTKNFLKLCKMKYYNGCLFHKVEKDFLAQAGDPTGTGTGGDSVYKFLYGEQARFFEDEIHPDLKHSKMGTVAMASAGENCNASQFYFTLRDNLDYLDGKHTVFGVVEEKEGLETLAKINDAYADDKGRPFKDIRIKHTYILDDPFDDPPQLADFIPEKSPEGKPRDEVAEERLEDNWVPLDETLGADELEEKIRSKEAHTNAAILESIGDIPDADIRPPDNVLFVCKLNPVTQDEDLYTIFSRFGNVTSADIIRDYKTGDSLCYAFIEFETKEACERAYFKMDNTLIDDRRIHVDFSQSVSKLWGQFRHGKRNANKDGCFKCGAPDHLARDCDQGPDSGPKYVLKDDNAQRGGHDRQRYDMVFEEDNVSHQERERQDTKKQKLDYQKGSDRSRHEGNGNRDHKEDDRSRGSRRHDESRSDKLSGHQSSEKDEVREHRRHHDSSRDRKNDGDYRRSSGNHQHEKDRLDGDRDKRDDREHRKSDQHRRDDGDHRKKSTHSDRYSRDDVYLERKARGFDDESYRKRRRVDDRR